MTRGSKPTGTLRIEGLPQGEVKFVSRRLECPGYETCVAVAVPDVTATVFVVDMVQLKIRCRLMGHLCPQAADAVSSRHLPHTLITSSEDSTIRMWDLR